MAKEYVRKLKIQAKYRSNSFLIKQSGVIIPWLNINGKWLGKAGFNVGNYVEITVESEKLTIRNISK